MGPIRQQDRNAGLDMREIIGVLLSRFWVIAFSGIFFGMCALIFTKMTTVPMYTSSTKLYIMNKSENSSDINSGDLQLSATLAGDYAQLIKDKTVMERVISELGLTCSAASLSSRVSVGMPDAGRIITISVTDTDPYMACKLATAVRDAAALHIKEVMNSEGVNVVEEADIPQGQTLFAYKKNGAVGMAAGMALAIGIIMLQYMMNDTIKSPDDIERYLGLSVLGSIPVMQQDRRRKKHRKQWIDTEE